MAYIAYKDAAYTQPVLISPVTVGDMSIGTASDWNTFVFDVGGITCHRTAISDIYTDYSWVNPDMLQQSVKMYFRSGWTLNLEFTRDSTVQMSFTNWCGITAGSTVWGGATGTASSPHPGDNPKTGFLFLQCNAYVAGTPHRCIVIVLGWSSAPGEFIRTNPSAIAISIEAFEADETDPQGGIPIEPEGGDGSYIFSGETLSFGTASDRSSDMGGGGLTAGTSPGTHLYDIDITALSDFLSTVYAGTSGLSFGDLWQAFKNTQHDPLSGIMGALMLPIDPTSTAISYIRLSGQSISVTGSCGYVTTRFAETAEASIAVEGSYNTFLDYEPFTKVTLYLPFIGTVGLNTNECMDGSITVKYWIDVCTGNCVAYVTLIDRFGYPTYYQYSGNCAAYIPVSSNDAGIASIVAGASSVISGTVSALSGNPAGVGGILSGAAVMAEPKTTQKHVGSFNGGAGCVGCLYPFIVINRPSSATAKNYTKLMGTISALSGKVGDYSGFTSFLQVDTSGVPATDSELREIQSALAEGVYI